jgi:hypothetical protein
MSWAITIGDGAINALRALEPFYNSVIIYEQPSQVSSGKQVLRLGGGEGGKRLNVGEVIGGELTGWIIGAVSILSQLVPSFLQFIKFVLSIVFSA